MKRLKSSDSALVTALPITVMSGTCWCTIGSAYVRPQPARQSLNGQGPAGDAAEERPHQQQRLVTVLVPSNQRPSWLADLSICNSIQPKVSTMIAVILKLVGQLVIWPLSETIEMDNSLIATRFANNSNHRGRRVESATRECATQQQFSCVCKVNCRAVSLCNISISVPGSNSTSE